MDKQQQQLHCAAEGVPPTPFTHAGPSMNPVLRNMALRCCSFLLFTEAPADMPAVIADRCCREPFFFCIPCQHVSNAWGGMYAMGPEFFLCNNL